MSADPEPAPDLLRGDAWLARLPEFLPALRTYIRLNVPPDVRARESASDLVHSVCRELLEQNPGFTWRGPEAFRAWLFQWALHKIQDRAKYYRAEMRTARREQGCDEEAGAAAIAASADSPSAGAIARENAILLEQAMDHLDADDRKVIGLCRIVGLSREEVAGILGKSPGAVRVHLSRALVRLGSRLEQLGVCG